MRITKTLLLSLFCSAGVMQAASAATCEHIIAAEWDTGFTAAIRITNDGSSAIDDWEVSWSYDDGSTLASHWNAEVSGSNPYTASALSWNGIINPGQSVEFGLQGLKGVTGGPAPAPSVSGEVCESGGSSSASSVESSSSSSSSASNEGELPTVTLERIYPDLELTQPTSIVQSPDGSRWFILEKRGLVSWVDVNDEAATSANTYIDLTDRVNANVEGGMLGMAFHPDYESNGQVYLSFTEDPPEDSSASQLSVIARFTEAPDGSTLAAESREDILTLEQPFTNHNGGQIEFGPDGYLYIAFGDGGAADDPFDNGQNPNNLFGTLVRIDVDNGSPYSIPADNPFVDGGGLPEVFAYGLRNPWRYSFDSVTGQLWAGDVGQASFEEINIIENGGNYGWRCREGFEATENECNSDGPYLDPVIAYGRDLGQSVTGGFVYRGTDFPALYGHYVFGDYGSGTIWALTESPETGEYKMQALTESDLLITSFAEDSRGELYAVDISGGALYRLTGDDNGSSSSSDSSSSASMSSASSSSSVSRPPAASVTCSVHPTNVWGNGYQLDVTVTNASESPIADWEVALSFDEPPQVTGSWNADLEASGNTLTATDVGWNGHLQPNQSASFGLQGSHDGSFTEPDCSAAN